MKFNGVTKVVRSVSYTLTKHSPTILTLLAVGGLVTTVVLAVKATPQAETLIFEADEAFRNGDSDAPTLSFKEKVIIAAPCYIPSIISGTATVACIIGMNSIHTRRQAALASAYSILDAAAKEYQEKVIETVGENKAAKIKDEVYKDTIEKNPSISKEVIITGNGDVLCCDAKFGRFFESSYEKIRSAVNDINAQINIGFGFATLNEFYDILNVPHIGLGNEWGWDTEHQLHVDFSSHLTPEGKPYLILDFNIEPLFL